MGDLSPMTSVDEQVDLLVVGGGPTGLLSAVLARHLGLTVAIIDAKSGPLDIGRADAMNARTQQYLEVVGILDELRSNGIECNTSSTFANGEFKSRQSKWWTSLAHCRHRNFLMLGQPEVESALLKILDAPVYYAESCVSISEDAETVTVVTDQGRRLSGKYAIGADGARSAVRAALGINFTGTKPEMVWSVLDTFVDTDFPVCSEIVTFQLNGQSRVSWIPRERGMARFYVLLDGEITQVKAEESIRQHLTPHRVDFVRTEWFSTFDVKERIASSFVSQSGNGRVILAGDAAHVHSVNGGQGLNTGIADAFSLAWRIAAAIQRQGIEAAEIIRSYDTERRAVAKDVINVAAKLVRDTTGSAKDYVATIEKNAGYITGMGVAYRHTGSTLVYESDMGIWKAGERCPDIYLADIKTRKSQRLYSMVSYGQTLILSIGGSQDCGLTGKDSVRPWTILASGRTSGNVLDGPLTFTSDLVATERRFVVVVRPDLYIGFVGDAKNVALYVNRIA